MFPLLVMTILRLSNVFCQELAMSVILNCKEQLSKDLSPDSLEHRAPQSLPWIHSGAVGGQQLQQHGVQSPQKQAANVLGKCRYASDSYHCVSD